MRGSPEAHNRLLNDVLISLGSRRECRVWRNETGAAWRDGKMIHYGLKGSPDIIGILCNGKFLGFECKTGKAEQSAEQKNFEAMITKYGGHYFVVRSVQEALDCLAWACSQVRE